MWNILCVSVTFFQYVETVLTLFGAGQGRAGAKISREGCKNGLYPLGHRGYGSRRYSSSSCSSCSSSLSSRPWALARPSIWWVSSWARVV